MIITVSIGAITYYGALRFIEKDAAQMNVTLLRQSSEMVEARLKEVESLVDQLSFHPKIASFLTMTEEEETNDQYKAIDTWKYMQSYGFTTNFISNFYIVFLNSKIIMSPKDISFRLPMYYEESIKISGMSYSEWYDEYLGKFHNGEYLPARSISTNGKLSSYITYIQTVPLGFRSNFKGTIFVHISESEIHRLLNRLNLSQGGWSVIYDANGKLLTSITDGTRSMNLTGIELTGAEGFIQQRRDGENMLVSYYKSPVNKWTYVSAVPMTVVMKKAAYIKQTNLFVIIIGLVVGVVIAVFFSYRNSRPIRTMLKKFEEKLVFTPLGTVASEYNVLEHSIAKLIHSNELLYSEIEKQTPLLRAALFDRLFRGEFTDSRELSSSLRDVGIEIAGEWFLVASIRMERFSGHYDREDLETLKVKRFFVKDHLVRELGAAGFVHDVRQDTIVVLLSLPQENKESAERKAEEVAAGLEELLNGDAEFQVAIGMGAMYANLLNVYRSYKEAMIALECVEVSSGERFLKYELISKDVHPYSYGLEIEQRVINLVKSGNEEGIRALLLDIQNGIAAERKRSGETLKLLLFDMSATVYRLIQEMLPPSPGRQKETEKINQFIKAVGSFSSFHEAYPVITDTLLQLSQFAGNQKKSHNVELRNSIIDYLNANYRDSSLSLTNVADHFAISEVYLSQFFKEQTGENFSSYMENKRLNHARDLLKQPNMTIEEISRQVGYTNPNTFYKAFKRIEGISPGMFRNRLR
jgi:AraC-like DNA-binding protein